MLVKIAAAAMPIQRVLENIKPRAQATTKAVVMAMCFPFFCDGSGVEKQICSAAQQLCELPYPRLGRYWVGGKCSLFLSCCFETAFSSRTPDLNSNEP